MIQRRTIEQIEADLYRKREVKPRTMLKPSAPGPITQADIDAIVSQQRLRLVAPEPAREANPKESNL